VEVHAVHQAEVHDVHAELGVHHVLERLQDVIDGGVTAGGGGRRGLHRLAHAVLLSNASLYAIQACSAHFECAWYVATPANATASPISSSSGSTCPLPCSRRVNSSTRRRVSCTVEPLVSSYSTEAAAWLIEHPCPS